jgi:thymidylate synthase (FAD)
MEDIIASPYDKSIVQNILNSGHMAATEFDYFIFGIEGYARVTEVQLVRKRIASYLIKSGRPDKSGKRSYDIVLPKSLDGLVSGEIKLDPNDVIIRNSNGRISCLGDWIDDDSEVYTKFNTDMIVGILENWYNNNVDLKSAPEEELRYLKPQATEFKAIIGMNTHSLLDWFKIRCCMNAQTEIRDLANKMLKLCKEASPDLFQKAGANCVCNAGYCTEGSR